MLKQEGKLELFFKPEIKKQNTEEEEEDNDEFPADFDERRHIGENESYICHLIREDSVEKFVQFVNKESIKLNSEIKRSPFETNPFLIKNKLSKSILGYKNQTLIEYAAFFGSIQIFQFLRMNEVELKPSIWLYAIHSNNPDMIHLLEECHVKPPCDSFDRCLREAIKCHHNNIANYIINNLLDEKPDSDDLEKYFFNNIMQYSFRYYNFDFLPDNFDGKLKFVYLYACQFDYFKIVNFLLNEKKVDVNSNIQINEVFF